MGGYFVIPMGKANVAFKHCCCFENLICFDILSNEKRLAS